ncbi:YY1-associated factor 2 [Festucalex cinctus]
MRNVRLPPEATPAVIGRGESRDWLPKPEFPARQLEADAATGATDSSQKDRHEDGRGVGGRGAQKTGFCSSRKLLPQTPRSGMGDKRSPTRPKRQAKPSSDEGFWDCSVCTYKNTAEAFKCMMCDVRKGTSTRKPRPVSQLVVSQQQASQQFVLPSQPKKEKKERVERDKSADKEAPALKKNGHKKMRPRLKNIDRSSAQHLEVTVGDLTVIITDFKEKARPSSAASAASSSSSSAAAASADRQNGSGSESVEKGLSRSSSPRGDGGSVNGESH